MLNPIFRYGIFTGMGNDCLTYITGNKHKFETAQRFLKLQGIEITQEELGIDEIQSDSIEEVAQDKAKKAYDLLKNPCLLAIQVGM